MKHLIEAIKTIERYNQKDLKHVIQEFEEYTGQKIPEAAIVDFSSFYDNTDFLTMDYLNGYGLKNLLQFENEKKNVNL